MHPVPLRLPADQRSRVEAVAAPGESMASVIRRALEVGLPVLERHAAEIRQTVDGEA